jgi:hypothetical protein
MVKPILPHHKELTKQQQKKLICKKINCFHAAKHHEQLHFKSQFTVHVPTINYTFQHFIA